VIAGSASNTSFAATALACASGPGAQTLSGTDQSAFRRALAQFPTGVTIVTACSPSSEVPVGLTVSSFNSVSLSPALVLWSLSNESQHLSAFAQGMAHRIHVLAHSQEELAKRFARSGTDKFAGVRELSDHAQPHQHDAFKRVPQLADCSARFDCTTEKLYPAGDHCIIISRVLHFEISERKPLVFARGGFFGLSSL